MDQVGEVLRYHHYAYRTEQTYCQWILRHIRFFGGKTQPRNLKAHHNEKHPVRTRMQGVVRDRG
ncbi:MAG: phage integrase N-terminal SAM-like domain-containing protein [Desulfobacterium sp.]|nr:phage integrase N-terminal SAM-like domain-containing protein [Desulfobacterium sp.]